MFPNLQEIVVSISDMLTQVFLGLVLIQIKAMFTIFLFERLMKSLQFSIFQFWLLILNLMYHTTCANVYGKSMGRSMDLELMTSQQVEFLKWNQGVAQVLFTDVPSH